MFRNIAPAAQGTSVATQARQKLGLPRKSFMSNVTYESSTPATQCPAYSRTTSDSDKAATRQAQLNVRLMGEDASCVDLMNAGRSYQVGTEEMLLRNKQVGAFNAPGARQDRVAKRLLNEVRVYTQVQAPTAVLPHKPTLHMNQLALELYHARKSFGCAAQQA
jgi:hypothetical protein